jgi:hypothetical protein
VKNLLLSVYLTFLICLTYLNGFSLKYQIDSEIRNNEKVIIQNLNKNISGKNNGNEKIIPALDSVEVKIIYSKGRLTVKRCMPDTLSINL